MVYLPQGFIKSPMVITLNTDDKQWTNQPAALTEFLGQTTKRTKVDLSNFSQVRIVALIKTAGAPTAIISVQYSKDLVSWNFLDGSSGPSLSLNTAGVRNSPLFEIDQNAREDVFIRIVGQNGDNFGDPAFSTIMLEFI